MLVLKTESPLSEALTKQLQIPDAFDEYGVLIEEDERLRNMTFIFDNENIIDMLRIQLSIEDYDLIIVDAYSDIFVGDMNQSNQVRKFLTDGLLAGGYDCAILFITSARLRPAVNTGFLEVLLVKNEICVLSK